MGDTNDESDLSDAPSTSISLFSIAAKSVASTKVAKEDLHAIVNTMGEGVAEELEIDVE